LVSRAGALGVDSNFFSTMVLGGNPTAGTTFPDVAVDIGFLGLSPDNKHMTGALNKGKKTLWVSLPGAFTPT